GDRAQGAATAPRHASPSLHEPSEVPTATCAAPEQVRAGEAEEYALVDRPPRSRGDLPLYVYGSRGRVLRPPHARLRRGDGFSHRLCTGRPVAARRTARSASLPVPRLRLSASPGTLLLGNGRRSLRRGQGAESRLFGGRPVVRARAVPPLRRQGHG